MGFTNELLVMYSFKKYQNKVLVSSVLLPRSVFIDIGENFSKFG